MSRAVLAKIVTAGSFWRLVTSWTPTGSTIAGATPSTRFEPARARLTAATSAAGK